MNIHRLCARALRCACASMACCAAIARTARAQQPVSPAPTDSVERLDSLTLRPLTLQPVTVTSTAPRRSEPSGAVTVTPQQIRHTPALDTYDMLRQTAGLEVHLQGQGPGFASDAAIRGFSSDHSADVALWIDGVPINEAVNGHAEGNSDWWLLMPQAVAGVEVFKGPTNTLFGNFAMAGVVNVRTLERMSGVQLEASGGAYGRAETSLLTGFDHERSSGVIGVRGLREDGWRPNSGYALGQGHGRWVGKLSSSVTLDAGLELYGADWDSPGFISDSIYQLGQFGAVADTSDGGFKRRAQERVSLRVIASPTVLWRTTAYATQSRWQLFLTIPPEGGAGEGSGSQTEEEDRRHGFGMTSAFTVALPRGELTAGVEGRWDASSYENWFTTTRVRDSAQILVDASQLSGAALLQAMVDLNPHLRLSAGGRYDVLDTRSTPAGQGTSSHAKGLFTPKIGVLAHVPRLGAVYGNVSRGFRQADRVISDPTLPFITAWAYEAGVKVERRVVSASVAAFRMDVSNEQTFDPITLSSFNGGASRRQGLEGDLAVRATPALRFDANVALTDAKYRHFVTEDGDTLDGTRVFNTSRWVGTLGVSVAPPGARWHLRLSGSALGPYTPFDLPGTELPSYGLLHASGGVRIGRVVSLEAGVRNLLDHMYPEVRAGDFVAPGQPRSAYATLRALL